jgi:hypothetical protein
VVPAPTEADFGTVEVAAMRLREHRPSRPIVRALRPSLLLHHTDLTCRRVRGGRADKLGHDGELGVLAVPAADFDAHDVKGLREAVGSLDLGKPFRIDVRTDDSGEVEHTRIVSDGIADRSDSIADGGA